jgi:hypothetical protein
MISLVLAISLLTTTQCETHTIKRVSATGRVIVLEDNTAWLSHERSVSITSLWLQGDQVQLCDKQLTNLLTREKAIVYFITTLAELDSIIEPVRKQIEETKKKQVKEKKKSKKDKKKQRVVEEE